jgi:hypothetical protein
MYHFTQLISGIWFTISEKQRIWRKKKKDKRSINATISHFAVKKKEAKLYRALECLAHHLFTGKDMGVAQN